MPPTLDRRARLHGQVRSARARAHANIALVKYWGKREVARNLPAVPSLSLTLEALSTTTEVRFDRQIATDELWLDGKAATPRELDRVAGMLNRVRRESGVELRARIVSDNDFPTAAGLASSASGFAALALASRAALGLSCEPTAISSLARASSVSAARSAHGGFVTLGAGAESAEPIAAPAALERVAMVVALTAEGRKQTSSTEGMLRTQQTSPYYPAWCDSAAGIHAQACRALVDDDLHGLGAQMERSTLMMHASMLAAEPALVYLNGVTLECMTCVRELRRRGAVAYFTMDAGPHVKVLTTEQEAPSVAHQLSEVPGVLQVLHSRGGPGAHLLEPA